MENMGRVLCMGRGGKKGDDETRVVFAYFTSSSSSRTASTHVAIRINRITCVGLCAKDGTC